MGLTVPIPTFPALLYIQSVLVPMSLILLIIHFRRVEVRGFPPSASDGTSDVQAAYHTDSTKSVPKNTRADRNGVLKFFIGEKMKK